MLDQPQLWLRSWSLEKPQRLPLTLPQCSEALGFLCWRATRFWGWFGRSALELRETDDEPLVLTIQRGWIWRRDWEVCDADGSCVGYIHGDVVLTEFGDEFGRWCWTKRPQQAVIVHSQRSVLAQVQRAEGYIVLTFDPDTISPFARMLLLAAVATHLVV